MSLSRSQAREQISGEQPDMPDIDSFSEAIGEFKEQFPGKGEASRELSNRFGVSRRTAQRWIKTGKLSTRTAGGRSKAANVQNAANEARKAAARRRAAAKVRQARTLRVGVIQVYYRSDGPGHGAALEGERTPGELSVSAERMGALADAIESGDPEAIEQAMEHATLAAYFDSDTGDPDSYPIGIDEYDSWDFS